jgi:hypothetical protein
MLSTDVFTKLRRSEAEKVLEIYKLFVRETDALIAMYEVGRSFARNLPEINKASTNIMCPYFPWAVFSELKSAIPDNFPIYGRLILRNF